MSACIVPHCKKSKWKISAGVTSHRLPKNSGICKQWLRAVNNPKYEEESDPRHLQHLRVCSLHFTPEDFVSSHTEGRRLKQTAVPSIDVNDEELESVLDPRQGKISRLKQTNMEGRNCCVKNCRRLSHDHLGRKIPNGLTFHCFPCWRKNEGDEISALTMRRRAAWVAAVGRGNITFSHIPTSMRVCSRHFHSGKPAYEMLESDPDWVPSLELGHSEGDDRHTELLLKPEKPKGKNKLKKAVEKTSLSIFRTPQGEPEPAAEGGRGGAGGGGGGGDGSEGGQRKRVKWEGGRKVKSAGGQITTGGGGGLTTGGGGGLTTGGGGGLTTGGGGGLTTGGGGGLTTGGGGGLTTGGGGGLTAAGGGGGLTAAGGGGVPVRAAVCPWREAKSLLQSILKPEADIRRRPADKTLEKTELSTKEAGFRDFFRESLRASLEGSSRSGTQQTISVRPTPVKTSSTESCVSCERLQRSVMVLQEELTRRTAVQVDVEEEVPDWAEPFEGDNEDEEVVESSSDSPKVSVHRLANVKLRRAPRFQKIWLHKFWFLRYSPVLNIMWCYVCRLHSDKKHASWGMIKGSRLFKLDNIKKHNSSIYHRNNMEHHMKQVCTV